MAIELSNIIFTDQDDIVPLSGVEQILNTGVANTLAGNDRITGTGTDYGFKNVATLNTDDGNDLIRGTATSIGNGITISFGSTLNTGNGNDGISGTGNVDIGLVNAGTINTNDGSDGISALGITNGFINEGTGTVNTGDGNDGLFANSNGNGFINRGVFNTNDGDDEISVLSLRSGIITDFGSILDTGNGNDKITGIGSLSVGISNSGIINTDDGEDSLISEGNFINRGEVFLGDGNDSITNIRTSNPNFQNFNFIGTGDGDDIIRTRVIYNEGVINTGNGNDSIIANESIYNNGGSINTGEGNDSLIANGGFQSGLNYSGSVFLGEGEDYIKGFGSGDFYGGNGNDTLELTPGTYTVGIWGVGDTSATFTKGNQLMITSEFEKLKAGNTLYDFTSLTAGQIITVA
jgi:hypothetical protein